MDKVTSQVIILMVIPLVSGIMSLIVAYINIFLMKKKVYKLYRSILASVLKLYVLNIALISIIHSAIFFEYVDENALFLRLPEAAEVVLLIIIPLLDDVLLGKENTWLKKILGIFSVVSGKTAYSDDIFEDNYDTQKIKKELASKNLPTISKTEWDRLLYHKKSDVSHKEDTNKGIRLKTHKKEIESNYSPFVFSGEDDSIYNRILKAKREELELKQELEEKEDEEDTLDLDKEPNENEFEDDVETTDY